MTFKKLVLLLAGLTALSVLFGCGSSNTTVAVLSIAFQPAPPSTLAVSTVVPITAVVSNDATNAGVDWSVTCGSAGACGSFSANHTASASSTNYTAPPSVPTGNTVTITATATANSGKSVSATITITAGGFTNAILNGSYVFEVLGADAATPAFYQLAGVLIADGNGNITGGEQTFTDVAIFPTDAITGGNYSIGADGRGTITLITADPDVGVNGTETLGVVILSASQALITEFDTSATSAGTMDLQTAVAAPAGGYAFVANGTDLNPFFMAMGGVFNIDSPGIISGAGSVADVNIEGSIANNATLSGAVSAPDSFGAVTIDLSTSFTGTPLEFIGYMIDPAHIKLVESDQFGSTAGQAIGQGAATGTFADNSSLSGTFVYGVLGQSAFGGAAWAGLFTADGTGNLTNGFTDENLGGNDISDTLTGLYVVNPSGTGRVDVVTNFGSNGAGPTFVFYLTGNGNPPLALNTDALSLGTGIVYPQAAGPFTFNGPYGVNFTAYTLIPSEDDGTAQVNVDGIAGTFSGSADINSMDFNTLVVSPTPNVPFSGTFTSSADGRFPGTLSVNSQSASEAFYIIDSNRAFVIETDNLQVTLGFLGLQTQIARPRK